MVWFRPVLLATRVFLLRKDSVRNSTIYALSSGQGKCGVAVVRISGPDSLKAFQKMTRTVQPEPRRALLRKIRDPETGEVIDNGLCLWFPGPHSFTGEDVVEFQVHGGPAILSSLFSALSKLKYRPAAPGDFTRRAFYNRKLDLTEIEGLADLIHAETEFQRKQALLQADGSLGRLYTGWRETLARGLAHLEAYIDFSEEDNLEKDVLEQLNQNLQDLTLEIREHLSDGRRGEILRSGVRTVILGEPNVGKSSLLNLLVRRNAAIVTPVAGTTRDVIELATNVSGYPVILADTAGICDFSSDIVETEGIRRARAYAESADFRILVIDAWKFRASGQPLENYVSEYVEKLELSHLLLTDGKLLANCLVVINKSDLLEDRVKNQLQSSGICTISCLEEKGLKGLVESLSSRFEKICGNPSRECPTISQTRHRTHLTRSLEHLENYFQVTSISGYDVVLAAQEIRGAIRELGKITGHVSAEEILDIIFTNFCIGK